MKRTRIAQIFADAESFGGREIPQKIQNWLFYKGED